MKILRIHNHYRIRAGEDLVFAEEGKLLRNKGHEVLDWTTDSQTIDARTLVRRAVLAGNTLWSEPARRALLEVLSGFEPDIAHVTNTFPLISPAAYYACARARVPVVQSLHNYRLLCPAATMVRDKRPCHSCLDDGLHASVRYKCYHASATESAVVAAMLGMHRTLGTYRRLIGGYIVLTEFAKKLFAESGFSEERLHVKPNFLSSDPGFSQTERSDVLFVGRLSQEKGIETLLEAWSSVPTDAVLHVVGDGPLAEHLKARNVQRVRFWGGLDRSAVLARMQRSRLLVLPSEWYEGFPMVLLEAFATGTPALVSALGGQSEMSDDERCALTFRAGDAAHLAERLSFALSRPDAMARLSVGARERFEQRYGIERNYDELMSIYERVRAAG